MLNDYLDGNFIFGIVKNLFQTHQIKKSYLALVYGVMKEDKGVIDVPIGRSKQDPRRRLAGKQAKGVLRPAVTEYQTLERFPGYSYVALFPKTGRTHQLRVHLQSIGRPVIGDELYAVGQPVQHFITRQALHASSVEFALPSGGKLKLEAALPADFATALEQLRQLC
jgi:23S rRNA pseudouridine1911/1915/1917 synthase